MLLFIGVDSGLLEIVTEPSSANRENPFPKSDNTVNININQIYISGTPIGTTIGTTIGA